MTLRKLEKQADGNFVCPECGKPLRFKDGEFVAVVDGQLDMDNYKPRYICDDCQVYYRAVLTTDYYDVFPLDGAEKNQKAKSKPSAPPAAEKPAGKGPIALPKEPKGDEKCPVCGNLFRFVDGGAVRVVNGQVDMENVKPKYECDTCGVFYREVLSSGFYLPYPQMEEDKISAPSPKKKKKSDVPPPKEEPSAAGREPIALPQVPTGKEKCPVCGELFRFVEGGAVRVVNGQVDMENVKPKYECDTCGVFYREVLTSGFYTAFPQEEEDKLQAKAKPKKQSKKAKPKKLRPTGDLAPMILKPDENGKCECPRCGEMMDYVEGGAVRLVDGKPDMDDVLAHFCCESCGAVFRRIVNTDYYQFSEK
jgi:transposase-like protein